VLVSRSCKAEKLNLSFDGGDSDSKKCKRGYRGAYGEVWRNFPLGRIWSLVSGDRFYVGSFDSHINSFYKDVL
jgi:hypothetical protein